MGTRPAAAQSEAGVGNQEEGGTLGDIPAGSLAMWEAGVESGDSWVWPLTNCLVVKLPKHSTPQFVHLWTGDDHAYLVGLL